MSDFAGLPEHLQASNLPTGSSAEPLEITLARRIEELESQVRRLEAKLERQKQAPCIHCQRRATRTTGTSA